MAEILVKAIDATHDDPVKDRRGCYKRGMPVVVMPDGHPWGKEEGPPKFVVVKLPGIDHKALHKYVREWDHATDAHTTLQRRRWKLHLDDLPHGAHAKHPIVVKASQKHQGPADLSWAELRAHFHNEETNTPETEDLE